MGKKFHFNNVFLCAIFLQNYLSKMKMFHLGSIYLFMKKKKFKKASQLHHNSENSKPEINPPDQWQNTSEFLF